MRKVIRAYPALLRAAWGQVLEYRAQTILWIISFLFPLVMMAVWLAVVDEAGPITGWGTADFASYYVGAAVMNYLTAAWIVWDWDDDIRTGSLSVKLLKPLDPIHHYTSQEIGWKIFILITLVPVVVVVAWASPYVNYPVTLARLVACAFGVAGGFLLNLLMSSAFAVMAFWTTQVRNVYQLVFGLGQFLSGWIAPLPLFPPAVRQAAYLLPFRSTLGFPIEILMGRLTWPEIWSGFAVTAAWILISFAVYRILWHFGLRRYEAVGG